MSLVNDVLRELNGRPNEPDGRTMDPLFGLRPTPAVGGERPRAFALALPCLLFAAGTTLAVLLLWPRTPWRSERSGAPPGAPPAVSARPPASSTLPEFAPTRSSVPIDTQLRDESIRTALGGAAPTSLRRILSERLGGTTRVRFVLNRAVDYSIRSRHDARQLEVVLSGTELSEALRPVDLGRGVIDELEAKPSNEGLSVRLALITRSRVQSQLVATRSGYELILDLAPFEPDRVSPPASAAIASSSMAPASTASVPTRAAVHETARATHSLAASDAGGSAHDADEPRADSPALLEIVPHVAQRDTARQTDRDRAEVDYRAGMEFVRAGKLARAIGHFESALFVQPRDSEIRRAHVAALLASGNLDLARRSVEAGLSLTPGSIALRMLEARVLDRQGHAREAVARLRQDPPPVIEAPAYHALLAGLERRWGQSEQAARRYQWIVRAEPRHAAWWLGLGLSLEDIGRSGRALSAYRVARTIGQLEPEAAEWMAHRIRVLSEASEQTAVD